MEIERIIEQEELNSDQIRAAKRPLDSHVQIIAPPGTGKTRTLVNRILYLILECKVSPDDITVLTLTNQAAQAFASKLSQLCRDIQHDYISPLVNVQTLHAYCHSMLLEHGHLIGHDFSQWTLASQSEQIYLLGELTGEKKRISGFVFNQWIESFRRMKLGQTPPSTAFNEYTLGLKQNRLIDFDDLLVLTRQLLESHGREIVTTKSLILDEFQDISPIQWEISQLIVGKSQSKCGLTVCGDPNQSIYEFLGASAEIFDTMAEIFDPVDVIMLRTNYRNTEEIYNAARAVLRKRTDVEFIENGPKPHLLEASNQHEEYDYLIREIKRLISLRKVPPNQIAALFRTQLGCTRFSTRLDHAGIKNVIFKGTSAIFQDDLLAKILSFLHLLQDKHHDLSLLSVMQTPRPLIAKASETKLRNYAAENQLSLWDTISDPDRLKAVVKTSITRAKVGKFIQLINEQTARISANPDDGNAIIKAVEALLEESNDPRAHPDSREMASFYNLVGVTLSRYRETTGMSTSALDYFLSNYLKFQTVPSNDQVVVSTVHASKGLEWDYVFVPECTDRTYPIFLDHENPSLIEQERRLLFVASTRARKQLHYTYSPQGTYRVYGRSRFLTQNLLNSHLELKTPRSPTIVVPVKQQWDAVHQKYPKLFGALPKLSVRGEVQKNWLVNRSRSFVTALPRLLLKR
ncbi:ATP-dependent DNA helicase Hmi1p, mitochondrial [Trichomonascus vanleenenianus]|uniref:ATP-dependent helicase n=1 Tax=Trichomonascus vanleenenianus TaxID=2268995 RepID=UPI003EC9FDC3